MLLMRIYVRKPQEGKADEAPTRLDHVQVRHTGWTRAQNFSGGLVAAAVREGWITIGKDTIVLQVQPEPLTYTITRMPGRYCCHCQEKLPDDTTGEMARAHVVAKHAGALSPDPAHSAGYCMLNHYECVLDEALQKKYGADGRGGHRG